ncbi:MAG: hypothetical protein E4H40_06690 [Candidatus Brocadiia bacterium]|nr:MAG: hypothetical protein E4H40_06690 [Candidatus Brocadiia bacterium]
MGGIIDVHNDSVLLIAPESQVARIKAAIEKLKNSKTPSAGVTKLTKTEKVDSFVSPDVNEAVQEKGTISSELEKMAASLGSGKKAGEVNDVKGDDLLGGMLETLESQKPAEKAPSQQAVAKEPDEAAKDGMVRISDSEYKTIMGRLAALETKAEGISSQEKAVKPEEPNASKEAQAMVSQYKPEQVVDGNEVLKIELSEHLTIEQLLTFVGQYLHLDYMYDPTKVKGDVALKLQGQLQGQLRVKDLYPLLESVLKFRGFAMTRKGNLVTIVESASALDIDPLLVDGGKRKVGYGDVTITRIFKLNHIDAESAKNLLVSMRLASLEDINTSAGRNGILIVTGYAFRMTRVEELLGMVDIPGEPKQFRSRQLKYTMSEALTTKVKSLADQLGTISITIAAGPAQPPGARPLPRGRPMPPRPTQPPASPTTPDATGQEGVFLEADERTNRILMIGLERQLDTVEELIDTLDVQKQDLRTLRIYDIKNVGAEDILQKLQNLGIVTGMGSIGTTGSRSTRSSSRITERGRTMPGQPGQPQPQPIAQQMSVDIESGSLVEEPQVIVVEATNSLLVNATPEQHDQIVTIISYVDAETMENANPYEIYSLENQDPLKMAEVLEKLIQETLKDKEGKIERVVQRRDEDIVIVPDESTFSIIVYASRKNQEWIGRLIKNLDKRRPQVLIDVTLVAITSSDQFTYDLEMISSLPDLDHTSGLLNSVAGTTSDAILGKLDAAHDRSRFEDFKSSGGTGSFFYADNQVQGLLTLMQEKKYGRVLSRPKI